MTTPKAAKVQAEIDKARAKLAEQQNRIKELETKRTELENMEIVDIVRGLSIPLDELAATLQALKAGGIPGSGQGGPKSATSISDTSTPDKEDAAE